jgi:hypothetical protein
MNPEKDIQHNISQLVAQISLLRLKPGKELEFKNSLLQQAKEMHGDKIANRIFVGGILGGSDLLAINIDHYLFPYTSLRFTLPSSVAKDAWSATNFSGYIYQNSENEISWDNLTNGLINGLNDEPYAFTLLKMNPQIYRITGVATEKYICNYLQHYLKEKSKKSDYWIWGSFSWFELLMLQAKSDFQTSLSAIREIRNFRFRINPFKILKKEEINDHNIKNTIPLFQSSITVPGIKDLHWLDENPKSKALDNVKIFGNTSSNEITVKIKISPGACLHIGKDLQGLKEKYHIKILASMGVNDIICKYNIKNNISYPEFLKELRRFSWVYSTQSTFLKEIKNLTDKSIKINNNSIREENNIPQNFLNNLYLIDLAKSQRKEYDNYYGKKLKTSKDSQDKVNIKIIGDALPILRFSQLVIILRGYLQDPSKRECVEEANTMVNHVLKLLKSEYEEDCLITGRYLDSISSFINDILLEESIGSYFTVPENEILGLSDLAIGGTRRIRQALKALPLNMMQIALEKILSQDNKDEKYIDSFTGV